MIDPQKFRHDRSQYERPRTPYLCGRGALWAKPCWQGPDLAGRCGGESECRPVKKGDRWECRRPKIAGGPCAEGPMPDGTCMHVRPPCLPRPSMRRWRGRASVIAALLVIACLAAFANFSGGSLAAIDPGPLSSVHQGFTIERGCGACHAAHDKGPLGWFAAAFTPQDNTGQCLTCHGFGGRERAAHNTHFAQRNDVAEVPCVSCHSEHKGADFSPADVANLVCTNCHNPAVDTFASNHPSFSESFPYEVPNSIYFDHAKHIDEYFTNERWTKAKNRDQEFAELARESCTMCHEVETATREVTPLGYEEVCANCHQHQINDRVLVMYTPDEVQPLSDLLFQLSIEEDEEAALLTLLDELREDNLDVFADVLTTQDESTAGQLLSGLSPLSVQMATEAWVEENEYEPAVESNIETTGWQVGEDPDGSQSIYYKPTGHADPVMRRWFEFAMETVRDDTLDEDVRDAALSYLLDAQSAPGACAKCHVSAIREGRDGAMIHWPYRGSVERPHTRYSHAPHISLLGPDVSCKTCHVMNESAEYAIFFENLESEQNDFQSNFISIQKATCDQCHNEGIVRFDCGLCHTYHRDPGFKVGFQDRRVIDE